MVDYISGHKQFDNASAIQLKVNIIQCIIVFVPEFEIRYRKNLAKL